MPTTKLLSEGGKRFPCPLVHARTANRQLMGYGHDMRRLNSPVDSFHQSEACNPSEGGSALLNGDFDGPDGIQPFVVVRSGAYPGNSCNSLQSNGIQNGFRVSNGEFSDASSGLPKMWFPSSSSTSVFDHVYSPVDDGGGSKRSVMAAMNGYAQSVDAQLGMDSVGYQQGPFAAQFSGGDRQCRPEAAAMGGSALRPSDLMLLLMLNQQRAQQHYGKPYGAERAFAEQSIGYPPYRHPLLCKADLSGSLRRNTEPYHRRGSQPFDMSSIESALNSAFGSGSPTEYNRINPEADGYPFAKPHPALEGVQPPFDQPVHPNDIAFLQSLSAYCQRANRCPTPPADAIFRDAMNTYGPGNSAWACEPIMSSQLAPSDLCSSANPHNSLALAGHALSLYSNVCKNPSQTAGFGEERYSRKVFVGGLPPDIDEEEIIVHFQRFGPLVVDWPHKAESKSYFPPKGYAFLIYSDERSVQDLIEACVLEDQKLYMCVSSPSIKDKPVQIRPWLLSDSDYVMDGSQPLDPRKTIFVGGVPRPLRAVELALIMNRVYGGVCYAGIDTDPELKYPKGAGRVAFSNQQSYITAISARFMQLRHGDIDKRVEVKPYVLDDQMCDECRGARCNGKFAPFFCANVACLQYYCENCWTAIHCRAGREFHKPLVKEGSDRPRGLPYRWA